MDSLVEQNGSSFLASILGLALITATLLINCSKKTKKPKSPPKPGTVEATSKQGETTQEENDKELEELKSPPHDPPPASVPNPAPVDPAKQAASTAAPKADDSKEEDTDLQSSRNWLAQADKKKKPGSKEVKKAKDKDKDKKTSKSAEKDRKAGPASAKAKPEESITALESTQKSKRKGKQSQEKIILSKEVDGGGIDRSAYAGDKKTTDKPGSGDKKAEKPEKGKKNSGSKTNSSSKTPGDDDRKIPDGKKKTDSVTMDNKPPASAADGSKKVLSDLPEDKTAPVNKSLYL